MQFLSLSSTDPALNLALEECLLQWLPADHPGLFLLWQNAPSVIVGRHQVTLDEIDS
ncbi:lipoyl protein ligase domain-containing protein, partial [Desulfovibrio sp.]